MADLLNIVAKNVRIYRESKGLTQQELADLADLHRNYILEVEKGSRNLTIITLEKIAQALNIQPERLLTNEQ
jgi:transcriptional regulator with XRE-family HTH domain